MKCVDNTSHEFLYYGKPLLGGATGACQVDGQSWFNVTATFCRDAALNASATAGGGTMTSYTLVEMYLYTVVIPLICLIGIIGNSINLIVLTSIVRNKPMDRMERSATIGLLALALSDLLFCTAVIPLAFVGYVGISDRLTFALVYRVYHPAIISTFITSSTWLTVVMAVSRYLAICHPLKARIIIGIRFAVGSIAVAFLFSVLLNVPRYLQSAIACVDSDHSIHYFQVPGLLQRHGALDQTLKHWFQRNDLRATITLLTRSLTESLDQTYYALYVVVGIVLPLVILSYSNFFVILS